MNDLPVQTEEYAVFWIMLRSAARSLILLLIALLLVQSGGAEAMAPAPPPNRVGWLTAGDDYEVDIPGQVQVGTEERFLLRPDGGLIFEGCCS